MLIWQRLFGKALHVVCHQVVNILRPSKLANSVEVLFKNLIPQVLDLLQSHEILNVYFPFPCNQKQRCLQLPLISFFT